MSLRIGLINDIHYGFPENRDPDKYLAPNIEEAVTAMNDDDPDLVIGLGDFIEHDDAAADRDKLRKLNDLLDGLDAPWYAIPGNHDIATLRPDTFLEGLAPANDRSFFSIDSGDTRLVCLDTTHQDDDLHPVAGRLGEEQRDWLDDQLDTDRRVLLFSHHLLHYRDLTGNFYFDDKPELAIVIDKRYVTKKIERHGSVAAVVSAHIHEEGVKDFHGVPHLTVGAMDKNEPETPFEPGFTQFTVAEDSAELNALDGTYTVSF
ncbi:MAG: metallophosphoesterase [Candidatus Nanohaloarchaea archaeon]|nr:metallophosphoesterase [Candidatus Nanohaloarchaea archaeon]